MQICTSGHSSMLLLCLKVLCTVHNIIHVLYVRYYMYRRKMCVHTVDTHSYISTVPTYVHLYYKTTICSYIISPYLIFLAKIFMNFTHKGRFLLFILQIYLYANEKAS